MDRIGKILKENDMLLKIDRVEAKESNGTTYYSAFVGKKKYSSKNPKINDFVGIEADFQVASKQNGQYTNWYINDPLPAIPASSSNNVSNNNEDKNKMFILSYAKDICVAVIQAGLLDAKNASAAVLYTQQVYDGLKNGLKAEEEAGQEPY